MRRLEGGLSQKIFKLDVLVGKSDHTFGLMLSPSKNLLQLSLCQCLPGTVLLDTDSTSLLFDYFSFISLTRKKINQRGLKPLAIAICSHS
jgi:hypothetical protein